MVERSFFKGGQLYVEVSVPENGGEGFLFTENDDLVLDFFGNGFKAIVAERQQNVPVPRSPSPGTGTTKKQKKSSPRVIKSDPGRKKLVNGAPALNLSVSNQTMEILWTAEFSGDRWRLEYAELDDTESNNKLVWEPIDNEPELRGRWFVHQIDTTSDVKFYRISLNPNQQPR